MTSTLAPTPTGGRHTDQREPPLPESQVPGAGAPGGRGRFQRIVRGPVGEPVWERPALLGLLALTALLYLWDLSASGYANSFYAAATQAGTKSWKAWFFGSLDSGNSITIDKPPAAYWITGLSARIFGFNSWSLLVPQALEGVAAVGLLYGTVRRVAGARAGLLAGAVLALTPAAVLMFRFDNPDALLTLLLVASAYAVTRALDNASGRWLALAGSALGFAFLTKMLEGLLVLPAFALVYLVCAPTTLRRRLVHTLLAGLALVASAGWWLLVVALWPTGSRPYIGGSTDNTVLNLVFGYNGFGRLFGSTGNGGGGGGGGTAGSSFGGSTGLTRLFSSEMGNEISWLLPAALVALVAGLVVTRRAPRTDRTRAALLLWGGWLITTGLVFSYMKGTIHPYYTVALAPPIAALVAIGTTSLWRLRATVHGRAGLAVIVVAAAGWSCVLLNRTSSWHPELRWLVVVAAVLAVAGLLIPTARLGRAARGVVVTTVVTGVAAGVIGTASFALATAAGPHTGSIPSVGPAAAQTSGMGGGGSAPGGSSTGSFGGTRPTGTGGSGSAPTGTKPTGTRPTGTPSGSTGRATSTSTGSSASVSVGGGGGGATSSAALVKALKATTGTWAAAVVGDQSAATLELSSGKAVIAIGGWSGTDNSPTLAQFKAYVQAGRIGYFISGGGQGGGTSTGVGSQITTWVAAHYKATTIGGETVYKLTS